MPVRIHTQGRVLELDAAPVPLSRLIWFESGLPARSLCSGVALCGRCRVRFLSAPPPLLPAEEHIFSPEELAQGWRLACRHHAADGMEVELPPESAPAPQNNEVRQAALPTLPPPGPVLPGTALPGLHTMARFSLSLALSPVLLAVDLGTTSIAWQALNQEGRVLAQGGGLNPQGGAGAEIMARLAVAREARGAALMQQKIVDFLQAAVAEAQAGGRQVESICLAANPAMTCLALGKDISGLATAPYRLDFKGGCWASLPGLPPLWIPPQIGPFVGGDLSVALPLLRYSPKPCILADLGTNGEFLLLDDGPTPLLAASVPLGPALEGVGMRCGMPAGPGSVNAFSITPQGLSARTVDNGPPVGICGVGYLSLLHCLRSLGVLDAQGGLSAGHTPLARKLADTATRGEHGWSLPLPGGLLLEAQDVENLLKVKAAFALALDILITGAGLEPRQIASVSLAGALGQYAPLDALEGLGFLGPALARKTRFAGNTALEGAARLLQDTSLRAFVQSMVDQSRVLDVAGPEFMEEFVRRMSFPD